MSQAGAVTARHRFDEDALSDYLSSALPGFAGPLTVAVQGRPVQSDLQLSAAAAAT